MPFPTVSFVLFFLVVWIAYHSSRLFPTLQKIILIAASFYFSYRANDLAPLFLLYSLLLSSLAFLSFSGHTRESRANKKLGLYLLAAIGPLIWFKYSYFFAKETGLYDSIPSAFIFVGSAPAGISFITFALSSWILASWNGSIVQHSFLERFCSLSFFPAQMSGPVLRPTIVTQFQENAPIHFGKAAAHFFLGVFLKLVCAAQAGALVDGAFNQPSEYAPIDLLVAVHAYALQIYADFAGYTLMALGVAYAFGIELPHNFNAPYLSTSVGQFWRRWHITLSLFWRDYIYIPLGGNRLGGGRQAFNLMFVMLLCGLWHGAGWTFIVWGLLHGCALVVGNFIPNTVKIPKLLAWLFCFEFITFAWIPFRAESLEQAFQVVSGIFHSGSSSSLTSNYFGFIFCFSTVFIEQWKREQIVSFSIQFWEDHPVLFLLLLCELMAFILLLSPPGIPNFIYFSF